LVVPFFAGKQPACSHAGKKEPPPSGKPFNRVRDIALNPERDSIVAAASRRHDTRPLLRD
jgi:hypothetical protein